MVEKLKTAIWFARRPAYWSHGFALAGRKLLPNHDRPELRAKARAWAAEHTVTVREALGAVGIAASMAPMDRILLAEGEELARRSTVKMGGAGDMELIYNSVRASGAIRVIETGVAYGWSSLAILAGLEERSSAKLVSVDMPYPKVGNERFVGVVVPERLRSKWVIVREPDRRGLKKAIALMGGGVDLCHYDSDKSWWGRRYAFNLLWNALAPNGILISDDIQDNLYFRDFVADRGLAFAVTEYQGKYVGITRKPG